MMSPGPLGDDADDQLGRLVDREGGLGRGDRRSPLDEADLELAPEAGRLGVQPVRLVGLGRELDRGRRTGSGPGRRR